MNKDMCKKRNLLILGSDYNALQVVKQAKKDGFYVIVTDLMKSSPAKEHADESWNISTTDIDLLEQRCIEKNITAIMFGASDFNINNARVLSKRLGLPIYCENDEAWNIARNKRLFKNICKKVGALVAEDYKLTDSLDILDLKQIQYPVVVKPSDKSGNRGMSYCENQEQLIEAYKKAREISLESPIIVERMLHGCEFNVHYALANGNAELLYFSSTHHQPGMLENIYSFKNTSNLHLKQYIEQTNETVKAVFKEAGCTEGIAWVDVIRDEDGKFYLLEMGYRFGGVMTYIPYEKVTGFNTIKWMLECSAGEKHKEEQLPILFNSCQTGCAASYHLFTLHEGVIFNIEGKTEIENIPNVWVDMPKGTGSEVRSNACIGLIGIYASDINELCEKVSLINSTLKITNQEGENMIIYFDDYNTLKKEYIEGINDFKS